MNDFKSRFIAAIEQTGDPTAPIKLQDAYGATNNLGALMSTIGDKQQVEVFTEKLLSAFPDEMEHIAADPNFVCALCSLLSSAIVAYGTNLIPGGVR